MPDPRFPHTAEELRHVADILDVLNAGCTAQSVGAAGGILDIYWCESKMGVIDRDDETWVYFPSARPVPQWNGAEQSWNQRDWNGMTKQYSAVGFLQGILMGLRIGIDAERAKIIDVALSDERYFTT